MATVPKPGSISFADRVAKTRSFEGGFGSTPRTARLRDQLCWKAAVTKEWINVAMGIGKCTFRQGIKVDVDRARLVTQAYKDTEGQPWALRRARAVEKLCEEMPIFIKPGELIVGDANGAPDEIRWYPEVSSDWMPEGVTTGGFSEMVTEGERREIVEDICEYWKGKSVRDMVWKALPSYIRPLVAEPMACSVNFTTWEESRVVTPYDYEALFKEGVQARIDRVEAALEELEQVVGEMDPAEYLSKKQEWEAMAICGRAIIRYAQRHAELAREQASREKEESRRKELEGMAALLDRVPASAPRTFHECLQFFWIIEVVGHHLAVSGNGSGVRVDQVWWPYYEADMKADRITRDKAVELVECVFLKIQEIGQPLHWPTSFSATAGFDIACNIDICGSDNEGKDVSNDLSCIAMEAMANLHLNQPILSLRYHRNISPEVVERAIDLDRAGMGHPSWFNEDLLERWGLTRGWSPEESKRVQASGCVTCNIPGRAIGASGILNAGGIIAIKLLEEVLGLFEPPTAPGMPQLKEPREMTSADEVLDAFCERLLFHSKVGVNTWNLAQQILMEYRPDPCNSLLMDEAVERGVDLTRLHKEHDTWPFLVSYGEINVADSLSAIQKLVFDEKKYTMEEVLQALKANWAGYEEMRQDFLNAPKYGNDDDVADAWAVKISTRINDTLSQVKDAWGYPLTLDGSTAAGFQSLGLACGASPDGRMASSTLDDGTLSPMAGADKEGPTAVLNSVGKIPYMHTQLLNQRFMPQFLEGENRNLFAQYLKEWYDKGTIPHIQFNVVDSEVLREAQEEPEKYTDLQVRVAGYSAHFVDLPEVTQNSIIDRTEQAFI